LNSKLKNALNICNDMFSDDLAWNKLPDSSKLIFAQALITAHEEIKKIPAEAGTKTQ
jgi:hypothetical protein